MITLDRAKQLMREEKSVVFNKRTRLRITNIIFNYDEQGNINASVELLDKSRESIARVPLSFVSENDNLEFIDALGYSKLKSVKSIALKIATELFVDLDKVKLVESQKTLHKFMKILIDLDNELSLHIKKNEKK